MSGMEKVAKVYKKAVLKIHPDKVSVADEEGHARATEMFKAVNSAFEDFKKSQEKRASNDIIEKNTAFDKSKTAEKGPKDSRRGRRR